MYVVNNCWQKKKKKSNDDYGKQLQPIADVASLA